MAAVARQRQIETGSPSDADKAGFRLEAVVMSQPKSLETSLPSLWRITRYFWPHLRQFRMLMASSFLALVAEVGLRLLEPWPLKFVFDYLIGQRRTPKRPLPKLLEGYDNTKLL